MKMISLRNRCPETKGTYVILDMRHDVSGTADWDGWNFSNEKWEGPTKEAYFPTHWAEIEREKE